jgi:hypothetical protein
MGVIKPNEDVPRPLSAKRNKDDPMRPLMPVTSSNGNASPYSKLLYLLL